MESQTRANTQSKEIKSKLEKTARKIKRARKNFKIAQKEAAEFGEIHKLLEGTDNDTADNIPPTISDVKSISLQCSVIPAASPGIKIFHEESTFSLFNQANCSLKNFINYQDTCNIFGLAEPIPSEDCFRKLIAYHVNESLMPEGGKSASVSLYVLYLMSVHEEPAFVSACFDFLIFHPFYIYSEDVFPIFINYGVKQDLFQFCPGLKKFSRKNEYIGRDSGKSRFPYFNLEMVGRILLHYITLKLIAVESKIKFLVKGVAKITLDPKIRSGPLQALYSTLLTTLCLRIKEKFTLKEIVSWLHLEDEHLLNQLEICRIVSKPVFPELHDVLVLKTISVIVKLRNYHTEAPIKINYIKLVLKKSRCEELQAVQLYCLLQLINGVLPCVTATEQDSLDINNILASLERKINKTDDSVDLIRLKLEMAKVRNLVTNSVCNRFVVD